MDIQGFDMNSLKLTFYSLLPLLIALIFGYDNVYKVLFLLLIGYIIYLILYCINTFDCRMVTLDINYERGGQKMKEKHLGIILGIPSRDPPALDEVRNIEIKSLQPSQDINFQIPGRKIKNMSKGQKLGINLEDPPTLNLNGEITTDDKSMTSTDVSGRNLLEGGKREEVMDMEESRGEEKSVEGEDMELIGKITRETEEEGGDMDLGDMDLGRRIEETIIYDNGERETFHTHANSHHQPREVSHT